MRLGRTLPGAYLARFGDMAKVPDPVYYIGKPELLKRRAVSIVGTRRPCAYTKQMTTRLASALAERGAVVVSGAAMGVDALAHRGAGAKNTVAVVAGGVDVRYPAVNAPLIETIEKEGLVLSRFEAGARPRPWSFVVRNEMVVALGEVLVVAEADRRSGSMRSVEYALKMGKPVYVLPHRLGESEGTNDLLREKKAEPIYDIDAFAARFGEKKKVQEEPLLAFCAEVPTLQEALDRFGQRVYEAELEGRIEIRDGLVYPVTG